MFLSIALCLIVLVIISVIVLYLAMRRRQKLRAQLVFSTFEGKHILITGAAHGIGREMALQLASQGANLILWDINSTTLVNIEQEISRMETGSTVQTNVVDVSDEKEVKKSAELVLQRLAKEGNHLSCLINNAGIVTGRRLLELSAADIKRTFGVNILSHFWTVKAFLPSLVLASGTIVTISSMMGSLSGVQLSDYCASKWALMGFHECLRLEVHSMCAERQKAHPQTQLLPVRTLVVCPYVVDTGMFRGSRIVTDKSWVRRLFPVLRQEFVASSVLSAIKDGREQLILPRTLSMVSALLHLLPTPLYDAIVSLAGGSHGMNGFRRD